MFVELDAVVQRVFPSRTTFLLDEHSTRCLQHLRQMARCLNPLVDGDGECAGEQSAQSSEGLAFPPR